jgi:hypothetical protein
MMSPTRAHVIDSLRSFASGQSPMRLVNADLNRLIAARSPFVGMEPLASMGFSLAGGILARWLCFLFTCRYGLLGPASRL